jgi:hypothetical protein
VRLSYCYVPCGGSPASGDHDQHLDEDVVDVAAAGLDNVDVGIAHTLGYSDGGLGVGEVRDVALRHGDGQPLADGLDKLGMRRPREDGNVSHLLLFLPFFLLFFASFASFSSFFLFVFLFFFFFFSICLFVLFLLFFYLADEKQSVLNRTK